MSSLLQRLSRGHRQLHRVLMRAKSSAASAAAALESHAGDHSDGGVLVDDAHLHNSSGLSTALPHSDGFFGDDKKYGGAFLPPPLVPVMQEVAAAYEAIKRDTQFLSDLSRLRRDFIGRPSPVCVVVVVAAIVVAIAIHRPSPSSVVISSRRHRPSPLCPSPLP
jgi:hypothetical protein